jgi:hypothetical protein
MSSQVTLPLRQVHLDFHTSPYIPDLFSEFDADIFADTLARTHVNSVTIFAKCHHGMSYFPTKMGTPHPALHGRDAVGEMIAALHARGMQAPIYLRTPYTNRTLKHVCFLTLLRERASRHTGTHSPLFLLLRSGKLNPCRQGFGATNTFRVWHVTRKLRAFPGSG